MRAASDGPELPGRLGSPDIDLTTDPRADPRMVAALAEIGLQGAAPTALVTAESSPAELIAFTEAAEPHYEMIYDGLVAGLPALDVDSSTEVITGADDNEIELFVHRPRGVDGPIPAVLHLHGGGMIMLTAAGGGFVRWRDELAAAGLLVVGVEFRNGGGRLGPHPFPAGLHDCAAALAWLGENLGRLGGSKVVVSGDSGGGNLSLALALKARQDATLHQLDGVYAMCPFISNAYAEKDPALPSLYENDGLALDMATMGGWARLYDPGGHHDTDPLAWPYHAAAADLAGLPPHRISVNELDPLRDEGLAYYRKLAAAGVVASSRTVNGTCHAGDFLFRKAMPDVYGATIADIAHFARTC